MQYFNRIATAVNDILLITNPNPIDATNNNWLSDMSNGICKLLLKTQIRWDKEQYDESGPATSDFAVNFGSFIRFLPLRQHFK